MSFSLLGFQIQILCILLLLSQTERESTVLAQELC